MTSPSLATVACLEPRHRRLSRRQARHSHSVVTFVLDGEIEVDHQGRYRLQPGDVHLIPGGSAHRTASERGARVWCASFLSASVASSLGDSALAPLRRVARGATPRFPIAPSRRPFVTSLFEELALDSAERAGRRAPHLLALLLDEIEQHAPLPSLPSHPRSPLAARALAYVDEHAFEPLSLSRLADELGCNRTHLASLIRREAGEPLGALVATIRMREAARRLRETDELIEVIGERVGYPDASRFARVFRRVMGKAPGEYRESPPSP